ncbi:LEAF RUST 10 DISEASE-RESISTANCE LOCUS RECEPTOR-LIKE PROTEIN KINASE-like 2.1 [Syzygium oleosum]|uniref:LEAF RUST 10 DISEASE-RESISTANCE LOCUS RECEPTOR-LIKE PROTEIN KINASE-like 2.1 n=1 Tax=Syzygium oleosum TaxID=219896 RepID=UPI0024BADFC6|nr:LEAF RUST 10 DISEASE-RESISTANCE LOCUS RECEPTOR-LIKE PROTEIN KINASE-like 2.1 [Syzygium oleosum]
MDLTMSYSSLPLLFTFSLQIHFLVPASGEFLPFQECAPFVCDNQQISYPFRHSEQPSYCGYPGYELGCDRDNLTLSMESLEYRVIHMNMSTQILEVARMDLSDDICLGRHVNTTLNSNLFDYTSSDLTSTLFYDCNSLPSPIPGSYQFSCPASRDGYFAPNVDLANPPHELCNFSVLVPISPSDDAPALPPPSEGSNVSATINRAAISLFLSKGFEITWIANTSQCENCTISGGRCGYDWTRREFNCFCSDRAYPRTCHGSSGKPGILGTKAIIGIAAMGTGIGIAFILMISFRKKPMIRRIMALIKQRSEHFDDKMKIEGLISSRRYTYKDIKRMTNSFKEKLGQGGYGCVYKGNLRDGQLVAVKLLKKLKGDAEEFFNEVASISRTSHVNVVSLLGFCFEGSKRALVYEFMPNGSLEKFIFSRSNNLEVDQLLSWDTLYQISLGIAHGLEYLHRGCNTRILHFDIKPHNILLDANYCPKISDFGLAKICPRQESIVSMLGARGTPGYIAPELFMRNIGGVSHKSDVYSYGMMVLEMVGKRKNIEVAVDRTSETYFPH